MDQTLINILGCVDQDFYQFARSQAPDRLETPDDWCVMRTTIGDFSYTLNYLTNSPTEPLCEIEIQLPQSSVRFQYDLKTHYETALPDY